MIEQMLKRYQIQSENDLINAFKEIFQEIVLLGLYRGGFFQKASFYGGTSLRILYGLERFSEDLDFCLLSKNEAFDLESYFAFVESEFSALGVEVSLQKKQKRIETPIQSAFLKNNTSIYNLYFQDLPSLSGKSLKIKLEIDTSPPLNFQTEFKTLLLPFAFNVRTMTLPNLYAGKMHALLFRKWKNRIKGRDWFDFEWYVKNGIELNLEHLESRMRESGDYEEERALQEEMLRQILLERIESLDVAQAIDEVRGFVRDARVFECWDRDYFRFLALKMKFCQIRL